MYAYEQRITCYADILGWKNACEDPSLDQQLLDAACSIADHASNFSLFVKETLKKTPGGSPTSIAQHAAICFSFFSDNFAVSAPVLYAQTFFKIIANSAYNLLRSGFLIRGAITLGNLYHDNRGIVFGPALIEAVDSEKSARYPRLLCSNRVIEFIDTTNYKKEVVIRDHDNIWVVNIACGSLHAMKDLNKLIENKLSTESQHNDKWQYIHEMLPLMYNQIFASRR